MQFVVLRYFNAAGADPDGEIGESHNPETHIIPLVLDAASGFREDVKVFGTDYDTPDGSCIRDYILIPTCLYTELSNTLSRIFILNGYLSI